MTFTRPTAPAPAISGATSLEESLAKSVRFAGWSFPTATRPAP
jgi:hypothetical protein